MKNARSPHTVTQGPWGVSVETSSAEPGVATLHVYQFRKDLPNAFGGKGRFQKGDAYGKRFQAATSLEASDLAFAYALEHGYTQVWYPQSMETREQIIAVAKRRLARRGA